MNKLNHLALIMDGNGRWAEAQGMNRGRGHIAGARNAFRIIEHARAEHIPTLSLFAFSQENRARPAAEVALLMNLLAHSLQDKLPFFREHKIRLTMIGERSTLPPNVRATIERVEEKTSPHRGMNLVLAVNYSGQYDIVQAARMLAEAGEPITKTGFESRLQTAPFGPPDLIIRTGGDERISNFFLWQAAYAEIRFEDKLWPEFTVSDLRAHLFRFERADRRFGKLPPAQTAPKQRKFFPSAP